jgi:uncharacterized membrane protein YhhN
VGFSWAKSLAVQNGPTTVRRFLNWFFRNRETGAITVAQWPNVTLWVVIVAGALLWIWPSAGRASIVLTVILKGGLLVWAADEIVRGVNPWRRCLGTAVAAYELTTLLL